MIQPFSIVIPCYRGTNSLEKLVDASLKLYPNYLTQIVLVFDCGKEECWDTIEKLCSKHSEVLGVRLSRNYGQHNATICGFNFVSEKWVVTLDEDMQQNPKSISILFDKLYNTKTDLIYGKYIQRSHSSFRNTTSLILKKLIKIGIPELHTDYSSFRLIESNIAKRTIDMKNSYTFLDGYLMWVTNNVASVVVKHYDSAAGKSSYTTKKLIEHSINIFITFSKLPLFILTYVAIFFLLASSGYSTYIIVKKLFNSDFAAGFPTLVSFMGFGFSTILFGMVVLGYYLHKINLKTTKRPNFNISKTTDLALNEKL